MKGWPSPSPLYGAQHLRPGSTETVYLAEGESCVDAMRSLGLLAVCSQGGAKAASRADWTGLRHAPKVTLLPDHDASGDGYMRDVYRIVRTLNPTAEYRLAALFASSPPDGQDVRDYVAGQVPEWNTFGPVPREPGDGLRDGLLEEIEARATPVPDAWDAPVQVAEEWDAPIPLDTVILPTWPDNVFPPTIEAFVKALAAFTETPPELPALMTLAVLATATHGKYCVMVKRGYFEPLNLWTCCALPPGQRKSSVVRAVAAPLRDWEHSIHKAMQPDIASAKSRLKIAEKRLEHLRRKAAKAEDEAAEALEAEIAGLEANLPVIPRPPRLWCDDCTPERLAVLMEQNCERMATISDEGGVFQMIAGRYSKGVPNLDVYLKSHAGDSVRVDRISREPVLLHHPLMTIGISPQPDVIARLSDTPEFRGRGLLGRFLYAVPRSNLGSRTCDGPFIPQDVEERYRAVVRAMLDYGGTDKAQPMRLCR